jgi:hypothetical protein
MDQLSNWVPALTTTSLFGVVLWLARTLIITRLKNSVKNEFDTKLEVLRSELKTKEAQIESLRTGAMSGLITRQGVLYKRKLEAIDQIWSAVKEIEKAKYISAAMATLKFEECAKESARNPKFRTFIEVIEGNFDIRKVNLSGAALARPFITPLAWAYYSAYSSILMLAVAKIQILKIGVDDPKKLLNFESSSNLLKTVLPSRTEYINKYGSSAQHYLLDEIEQLLITELKNIQDGHEADKENAKRAAEIIKEVENVTKEVAEIQASA